jgi:HTH-type transcriptional regulator/antitoxin MqsA
MMTRQELPMDFCPVCDGPLEVVSEEREVRIGARTTRVRDQFSYCDACEEAYYAAGQMDATLLRASDAIRRKEGLLTPDQIRGIRQTLGLTQEALEKLLGVGPKTVVRWEKGTVFQNRSTDSLLRVVGAQPESARFLAHLHGVALPKGPRALAR